MTVRFLHLLCWRYSPYPNELLHPYHGVHLIVLLPCHIPRQHKYQFKGNSKMHGRARHSSVWGHSCGASWARSAGEHYFWSSDITSETYFASIRKLSFTWILTLVTTLVKKNRNILQIGLQVTFLPKGREASLSESTTHSSARNPHISSGIRRTFLPQEWKLARPTKHKHGR